MKRSGNLELNEYQKQAGATADYPKMGENLIYPAVGLGEEAGEVLGKVKKLWRNRLITSALDQNFTQADGDAIVKELGDVMWYAAAMATELGVSLEFVAQENLTKLADRKQRGVIKSEGDNR